MLLCRLFAFICCIWLCSAKPKPNPQFGPIGQGYVPYNDIFIPQEAYNIFNDYAQKIRAAFSDFPQTQNSGFGQIGGQKGLSFQNG